MGAEAEELNPSLPAIEVQFRRITMEVAAPPVVAEEVNAAAEVEIVAAGLELDLRSSGGASALWEEDEAVASEFVPFIRSGSFADVGLRSFMEDEHICIDDLAAHLGSIFRCPTPSAFYGVFDGHGGAEAAEYMKKHAMRIFFEEADFPQSEEPDGEFLEEVESSICRAFLLADDALAEDCSISSSSGTAAITALVLGRVLLVANAGDCRAVLCRKGLPLDMSVDHRPSLPSERRRIEAAGASVDDGYLNGVLSLSRALGDWDLKPTDPLAPRPLIPDPELRRLRLTPDDEFLIMACDGIWDVMTSEHAVDVVRRGLRRHDDPEKCARELVLEALRLKTFDNLTAIVVCFSEEHREKAAAVPLPQGGKLKCCTFSAEALCLLKTWMDV